MIVQVKIKSMAEKVIIVDDEPDICELLADEFEIVGIQTVTASNGRKAFELFANSHFQAVISDVRMPGGDGVELLDKIMTTFPQFRNFFFITGYADLAIAEALNKGACAMHSKPFDNDTLISDVKRRFKPLTEILSFPQKTVSTLNAHFDSIDQIQFGRSGIFVPCSMCKQKVNDSIEFNFTEGGRATLEGSGIIRWIRGETKSALKSGIGIEFTYLKENCRNETIAKMTKAKSPAHIPLGNTDGL